MRAIQRTLLLPLASFLLLLGAAAFVSHGAAKAPEAQLNRRIVGYLRALYLGDADAAARFRQDRRVGIEMKRAEVFQGRKWYLAGLQIGDAGRGAKAHAAWLDDDDRVRAEEIQTWTLDAEGVWVLWAFDSVP